MQTTIRIKGIEQLQRQLNGIARKQLPFALSKALNDTVYGAQQSAKKEIKDSFDRPTPVIVNSARYDKSDKRRLVARVYISEDSRGADPSAILRPHITGESRITKASESRLRRTAWMGSGQWMVPGVGAPLDRYGNISSANMKKILTQLDAFRESGYNKIGRGASRRGIGSIYGIPFVGVFKRTGKNTSIPVLHFTYKKPRYEAGRFDFTYVVKEHVKKHFQANFAKAWNYALKTAR